MDIAIYLEMIQKGRERPEKLLTSGISLDKYAAIVSSGRQLEGRSGSRFTIRLGGRVSFSAM